MSLIPLIRQVLSPPRRAIQRSLKNKKIRRHQAARRLEASQAYEQLRTHSTRPELDASTCRKIAEYSADVLGSLDFQPWLRVYALYQGRFVEGWIPDDYYSMQVLPSLYQPHKPFQHKRTLSKRLFDSDAFPDLAYCVNGKWFTQDYESIEGKELLDHIFGETTEVYLKSEDSGRGNGVQRIGRNDFSRLTELPDANYVVQRPVVQHELFDEIYPRATATLRITTSFFQGEPPRYRASYLRLGYSATTHVQSDKSLRCTVTDDEGSLADEALDESWLPHPRHPDSGFVFEGSQIPCFKDARDLCLQLHAKLPHDPIVGWDIGVTQSGKIEIMEWNSGHTDIKFSEATVGPIFAGCDFGRFQLGH